MKQLLLAGMVATLMPLTSNAGNESLTKDAAAIFSSPAVKKLISSHEGDITQLNLKYEFPMMTADGPEVYSLSFSYKPTMAPNAIERICKATVFVGSDSRKIAVSDVDCEE